MRYISCQYNGKMLTGKDVIQAGEEAIREVDEAIVKSQGRGANSAGQDF